MSDDFYIEGEEKFGAISSHFYNISKIIPVFRRYNKFVLSDLLSYKISDAMDVGCGTGNMLISLWNLNPSATYLGVDPSEDMIKIAASKAKKKGSTEKINFKQGSSRMIPTDSRFDMIYVSMSFHHWKQRNESIIYLMQFLKQQGHLNIYELQPQKTFYKRIANSHTMSEEKFKEIGSELNLNFNIKKDKEFIRCSFTQKIE